MKKNVNFKEISVYDTPARSPGFLLWHISTSWRRQIETALKQLSITHPQFVVLATLGWLTRKGDLVTQAALGTLAGLDPNTLSQVIKGLEQKGLVRRIASSDSRAKHPLLTAQGNEVVTKALPIVETADSQFFSGITPEEMQQLIHIFQKITSGYEVN